MAIKLADYQLDAVSKMKNGCILCGGVGSGKSRTALAYYYKCEGGELGTNHYIRMTDSPRDLYIITTAKKRDTLEWEGELPPFLLSTNKKVSAYDNKIVVDSWNNIKKYADIKNAFFIFDEQRVVGTGVWVHSFLKIAKNNQWVLLSATPGDTWRDYIPVFLANGFYKNRTEFINEHIIYSRFTKYPKIDRYVNTRRLVRLRDSILINMDFHRKTISHHEDIYTDYDEITYKSIMRNRWDIWNNCPIQNAGGLCYALRRLVNSDESRRDAVLEIAKKYKRVIIFYNFDYELDILKEINYVENTEISEWNGHKHQPIPDGNAWVYLVQYTAGCEGWNCIRTNAIVFYSQNYSYRVTVQAAGRIDRLNTPYTDLYYYHIKSHSSIDLMISRALNAKKNFNEGKFVFGGN
jgi:hypothetical protein